MFKLEGSAGCYLFVKPNESRWSIWSGLNGEKRYIKSGSSGQSCPAHQQNKFSTRFNTNDWEFNKAGEDEEEVWEEGGVIVQCSVHEQSSAN